MVNRYTIYIDDKATRCWLRDLIASDAEMHPVFTTNRNHAMIFDSFNRAKAWRARLRDMGYAPHIEPYFGDRRPWA